MATLAFDSLDIKYEVSGSGPLLILHHGFGSWGRDWARGGWLEALEPHASVLIFDAVGHGMSTRSHDPIDHEIERRAAVVTALADEVGAEKFGYLGFSLGGRVGFELAASSPERLSALAIGGMHLLPPSLDQERFERRIRVLRSGRARSIEQPDGDRPGNDPLALAASHEALLRWRGTTGRLANHRVPTILFCGEKDSFYPNAAESALVMGFDFVALPDTDHDGAFFSPGRAARDVAEFMGANLG
jgi:pimeloyl-ACP methyl ester carboxylesterase